MKAVLGASAVTIGSCIRSVCRVPGLPKTGVTFMMERTDVPFGGSCLTHRQMSVVCHDLVQRQAIQLMYIFGRDMVVTHGLFFSSPPRLGREGSCGLGF